MNIGYRIAVACSAAAIGASFAGAGAALADTRVVSGNDAGLVAESVDKHAQLTLTVRKVATNPYDDVPEGAKPSAIAGARFTLSLVEGVDVTTTAGREEAKGLSLVDASSKTLNPIAQRTTDADGVAEFTGLAPGLYLLEESAPDGNYNYHLSSPKLIILPLGNATGDGFDYENVVVTKPEPSRPPTTTTTRTRPPATETTTRPPLPPIPPITVTTRTTSPTTHVTEPPTTTTSTPSTTATIATPGKTPGTTTVAPPGKSSRDGGLASTGANVLWLVGIAAILIIGGLALARRNNGGQK